MSCDLNKRKNQNTMWIYGKHAVKSALSNKRRICLNLLYTDSSYHHITDLICLHTKLTTRKVDAREIDKIVGYDVLHQNLALLVQPLDHLSLDDLLTKHAETSCIIALDQLTDPHNIGAILRSAAAFFVDAVLITAHHSPKDTSIMAKISSGGIELTPLIKITNLSHALNQLKDNGYWIIGLDGAATDKINKIKLKGKIVFVLGSEGKGLRRLTAQNCDILVKFFINEAIESLNVSNACAIALYEYSLQNQP